MSEDEVAVERDVNAPLTSLVRGAGAGTPIAAASGDVAASPIAGVYTAVTQTATVVAYHVMQHGRVDRDVLRDDLALLDGWGRGAKTYRAASSELRRWLDSVHAGDTTAVPDRSSEPAARVTALGVWFRNDPLGLIESAVAVARLTHLDAPTVLMAVASASAVAASCFGMSGNDLLMGVVETVEDAGRLIETDAYRYEATAEVTETVASIRRLSVLMGRAPDRIVARLCEDNGPVGTNGVLLGLALGASTGEAIRLIEVAAMAGGSETAAVAGGILGARSGLRRWPWRVPNEQWFAEIGRRLATLNSETRDLPVPYAVEERMSLPREVDHELD